MTTTKAKKPAARPSARAKAKAAKPLEVELIECPPLVGLGEAAAILGTQKQNLIRYNGERLAGLPAPLQERKIKGFEVIATPLWPRAEIVALAKLRRARRR
jgi:hypothetical protein